MSLPGLGDFIVTCFTGSPIIAQVKLTNPGSSSDYVTTLDASGAGGSVLPGANAQQIAEGISETSANVGDIIDWQVSPGAGTNKVANVITSLMFDGNNCVFRATSVQSG